MNFLGWFDWSGSTDFSKRPEQPMWVSVYKQAVLCPVCGGSGHVGTPASTSITNIKPCHGCGGKGWVTI